ncbi:hypothetical protein [Streptomyces sp. NPDC005799]|uniref:hypothetical protein n=1 Tax=Streptomyces sp. NPDC005799 TaxID=3154678 RepID=UPI0033E462D4
MSTFDALREQLRRARQARDGADAALAATCEQLKRLALREAQLQRVFDADDEQHVVSREALIEERARLGATLERLRGQRAAALSAEAGLADEFAVFTDPVTGIGQLDDSTPILMMPVRLETRFKKSAPEPGAVGRDELWVRIYPDDCWIDTFDPALTTSEFEDARRYWISIWQAGGVEDQDRGAWRALASAHGSGRSAWIVQEYQPGNLADKPTKALPQDVILTIVVESALPAVESAAVVAYWTAVWRADGDAGATAVARTALDAAVGTARAGQLAATTTPANLGAPPASGFAKADVAVSVAYAELPAADTKQTAWARPPRANALPDRFVFVGYETVGHASPVVVVGRPVPSQLILGPDPGAAEADQLRHDEDGNLVIPDELRWMSDFERAVSVGMGIVVGLTPAQARKGFDRVLVVGLRLNADEHVAKTELEELLRHHSYRRTGLAVVPQGTPTNNTEDVGSGRLLDDPDASFDDLKQPLFQPATDWLDKSDGQWLAEHLGIDPAVFAHTHAAGGSDQVAARAMNVALWPATLGYWMETMLSPVFSEGAVEQTRDFFTRYVIAGGACPAIRIGEQPYGILPTTAISRMAWFDRPGGMGVAAAGVSGPTLGYLRRLYPILLGIDQDLRTKAADVAHVGATGDPHAILLDILGLHSGSVEWAQRYAESLTTLFNRLNLLGLGDMALAFLTLIERVAARQKLNSLGYTGEQDPAILGLSFSGRHNVLKGGVVDDRPLSETAPIRSYTDGGDNYVRWLIDAAHTSLDALYKEQGFTGNERPTAILYLLLRHALQLGYSDVSIRLFEAAGIYTPEKVRAARSDDPFLHIRDNRLDSESRYFPLYTAAAGITGSAVQPVHEYIAANLHTVLSPFHLNGQLKALERLEDRPTAQLERAFADHVDCCGYRLDAWLLGIVNVQLAAMRTVKDGSEAPARQGIHLGGYAWLEPLRPEGRVLEPVQLTDDDLSKAFAGAPALVHDTTNQGYVHAPSLNHAVAAAVLRNGYVSNTSAANRQTMAVNLTSERVRTALELIEGIRAGQNLSNLLGYQFERGLHDRHGLAEVDKFIYKLRKAFPIRADRIKSTRTDGDVSIEAVEARNVVDGLALVEHMIATDTFSYPFGKGDILPAASQAERTAIDAEAGRLREAHDAIADLALSEGVYQAVLGNYDRVASTYDAYARGNFPPEPDVVHTPRNGVGITHRVALQLEPDVSATSSPVPGLSMTPRAQAEPGLNSWLAGTLPPPTDVSCAVTFRSASLGTTVTEEVTLDQVGLQPADLVVVIRDDSEQAMAELDDRIVQVVEAAFDPRPDVPVSIAYMKRPSAPFSVFEVMPLVRNLRRLTTRSRALRPSDLTLMNEAEESADSASVGDKSRLERVRDAMQVLRDDIASFLPGLEGPLSDPANRRAEILTNVDTYLADLAALLSRAARFAVPQAGWGFAYDFRRRTFAALLEQCARWVKRWDDRIAEFDANVAASHTAATDEEKLALLAQAERSISTTTTSPPPAPAAYESHLVNVKRPAFDARRHQFAAIATTNRRSIAQLLADVRGLLPVSDFDFAAFDLAEHEGEMVRFTQDAVRVATVVQTELDRRLKLSQDRFDDHDGSSMAVTRLAALEDAARALLGEDFRIYPGFTLASAQGDELAKAVAASTSGELFEYLTSPTDPERQPVDFPVDDWLYGIARVREKLHAWEQVVMFAGALQRPEPELLPVQLPFTADDRWIGLDFPASLALDGDRLLYTAHHAANFDKTARQCGLLLDEWTETIPVQSVDTGIVFHHDRPNSEAPQTMLLVTPTDFRGRWRWDDLIGALNETLDLAKRRAVEPADLDDSPYAPFLPATVLATQLQQLTIAADLAFNNKIAIPEND